MMSLQIVTGSDDFTIGGFVTIVDNVAVDNDFMVDYEVTVNGDVTEVDNVTTDDDNKVVNNVTVDCHRQW